MDRRAEVSAARARKEKMPQRAERGVAINGSIQEARSHKSKAHF